MTIMGADTGGGGRGGRIPPSETRKGRPPEIAIFKIF